MFSRKRRILLLILGLSLVIGLARPDMAEAKNITATYVQEHFWFRDDDGSESTATGYGTGNLAVDAVIGASETFAVGQAFRLRMSVLKNNNGDLFLTVTPKLQFKAGGTTGSCITDTWTDVPTQTGCGSNASCQATSPNFTDGTATTRQTDATHTHVGGDMIEIDGAPNSATYSTGNSTDHAEWEWMLDSDNAAGSTVYTFRVVHSDGSALNTYTVCPTLETDASAVTSFTFNSYRWYVDPTSPESEDVTDPWGNPDINQDTAISPLPVSNDPPNTTQELRLRVNFTVNGDGLAFGEKAFKLQFKADAAACTDATGWTDVGAAQAWEFATSGVTDGTDLSVSRLSPVSNVLEEYIKSNPTGTNPFSANIGDEIEYDFHIVGTNSATATRYRFRVIESGGTVFDAYTNCPTLTTEPGVGDLLRHGNFFSGGSEQGFFWAD